MFHSSIRLALFCCLALSLTLTSCENDLLGPDATEVAAGAEADAEFASLLKSDLDDQGSKSNDDDVRVACFTFLYPVSIVTREGEVLTAADSTELRAIGRELGRDRRAASFQYPFQVVTAEGETVELADRAAFRELRQSCRAGRRDRRCTPCFDLVFPVSLTTEGGTTVTAENAEALRGIFHRLRRTRTKATFNYPLQAVTTDGQTVDLADRAALYALRASCRPDEAG